MSLLDAADPVDSGDIWAQVKIPVPRHALYDEINAGLFQAELKLIDRAIEMHRRGERPTPQSEGEATWWPRRRPEDSRIDPQVPLAQLFDAIRVADPNRFPAHFEMHGHTYKIVLEKIDD